MRGRPWWIALAVMVGGTLMTGSFLAGSLSSTMRHMFKGQSTARVSAVRAFYGDLAFAGCVGRDAVIAAAEARGWAWRASDGPHWCTTPDTLENWVAVTIEPALMFSTEDENTRWFGFDAQGCMTDWQAASC